MTLLTTSEGVFTRPHHGPGIVWARNSRMATRSDARRITRLRLDMRGRSKSPCQEAYQVALYAESSRTTQVAVNSIIHNLELMSITCLLRTMQNTKTQVVIHRTMETIATNDIANSLDHEPAVLIMPGGAGHVCIESDLLQYGGLTNEASIWAFGWR